MSQWPERSAGSDMMIASSSGNLILTLLAAIFWPSASTSSEPRCRSVRFCPHTRIDRGGLHVESHGVVSTYDLTRYPSSANVLKLRASRTSHRRPVLRRSRLRGVSGPVRLRRRDPTLESQSRVRAQAPLAALAIAPIGPRPRARRGGAGARGDGHFDEEWRPEYCRPQVIWQWSRRRPGVFSRRTNSPCEAGLAAREAR